jgi:hypothetical protein
LAPQIVSTALFTTRYAQGHEGHEAGFHFHPLLFVVFALFVVPYPSSAALAVSDSVLGSRLHGHDRYRDRRRIRSRLPENPHQPVILFILSIHVDVYMGALEPAGYAGGSTDMDEQDGQDGDCTDRGEALPQRIPTPIVETE